MRSRPENLSSARPRSARTPSQPDEKARVRETRGSSGVATEDRPAFAIDRELMLQLAQRAPSFSGRGREPPKPGVEICAPRLCFVSKQPVRAWIWNKSERGRGRGRGRGKVEDEGDAMIRNIRSRGREQTHVALHAGRPDTPTSARDRRAGRPLRTAGGQPRSPRRRCPRPRRRCPRRSPRTGRASFWASACRTARSRPSTSGGGRGRSWALGGDQGRGASRRARSGGSELSPHLGEVGSTARAHRCIASRRRHPASPGSGPGQ